MEPAPAPADADAGAAPQQLAAALRSQQASAADEQGDDVSQHPRHVFVFSTAGKPIYSYRGDESRLAGLMATAEAILSVAHSKGHTLKHVRWVVGGWGKGHRWNTLGAAHKLALPLLLLEASSCSQLFHPLTFMPAGRGSMCLPSWSARHCAWWGCRRWQSRPPCCACRCVSMCPAVCIASSCAAQGNTALLCTASTTTLVHARAHCLLASPCALLQLTLVHGQIVSLLTSTALHTMFARNPGYDARKLLGEAGWPPPSRAAAALGAWLHDQPLPGSLPTGTQSLHLQVGLM